MILREMNVHPFPAMHWVQYFLCNKIPCKLLRSSNTDSRSTRDSLVEWNISGVYPERFYLLALAVQVFILVYLFFPQNHENITLE